MAPSRIVALAACIGLIAIAGPVGAQSGPVSPAHDDRAAARPIGSLPYTDASVTHGANLEAGEASPCGHVGATVWYTLTLASDSLVEIRTAASDFDTLVAVFEDHHPVTCNDEADGTAAALRFQAQEGTTYHIQLGGHLGATGRLSLRVVHPGPDAPPPVFADDPADARIRPGVRISAAGGCTANFIFAGTGVLAGRAYLGTAAHCVGHHIGSIVSVTRNAFGKSSFDQIGRVAYSSFKQQQIFSSPCPVIVSCSSRPDAPDFALIELLPDVLLDASPSVIGFGGPTGVAPRGDLHPGQKVLSFGNSSLRFGIDPLNPAEGYLTETGASDRDAYAMFVSPRVFGDSGSDALLADGRALGVVVTIATGEEEGLPATNGLTLVETGLRVARTAGFTVELQTAPLLTSGLLPDPAAAA